MRSEDDDDKKEDLFAPPILEPQVGQIASAEWIKNNFDTKSAAIRYLTGQGHST